MLEGLTLGLYRFVMRAEETIHMPAYKGGVLRGGFGTVLKHMACAQKGHGCSRREESCEKCPILSACPYKAVFEASPPEGADRLRNLQDIPRPFVLRIPDDPRTEILPGQHLEWEIALIGKAVGYLPYFVVTFQELGQTGFGLWNNGRRAQAQMESVLAVDPFTGTSTRVFEGAKNLMNGTDPPIVRGEDIEKIACLRRSDSVVLDFVSITRLKFKAEFVMHPDFHVVVRNLLRRLSTLSGFYQEHETDVDFRGLIERAEAVKGESVSIKWKEWQRYSGRSKQLMDFGGFTGRMRYVGDLAEFLPLILYGSLVNVGKGTTFGLGQYVVQP